MFFFEFNDKDFDTIDSYLRIDLPIVPRVGDFMEFSYDTMNNFIEELQKTSDLTEREKEVIDDLIYLTQNCGRYYRVIDIRYEYIEIEYCPVVCLRYSYYEANEAENKRLEECKKQEDLLSKLNTIEQYSLLAAKNVLTIEDAALLTGLSRSHIYKLTSTKQIPYYKPNGKQIYFDRAELEAWMKQNRVGTIAEAQQKAVAYVVGKGDHR